MAKSSKKNVAVKSGKASLVVVAHKSKAFAAGKLVFKAQKAHRVRTAIYGQGLAVLVKALADFARTGVVNPQTLYLAQAEPFQGNPMMALRCGTTDKAQFKFGQSKAGMLAEALRAHTQDEVLSALGEVIGETQLRLDYDAEGEYTPAPAQTETILPPPAPAAAPVTHESLIHAKQAELAQLMRRASALQREIAALGRQSQVA